MSSTCMCAALHCFASSSEFANVQESDHVDLKELEDRHVGTDCKSEW